MYPEDKSRKPRLPTAPQSGAWYNKKPDGFVPRRQTYGACGGGLGEMPVSENFVTVEDMLGMPSLSGVRMIAGKSGARRRVSSVTVLDTPDGAAWLRGEEFVLTTAYGVKDDERKMTELIYQLHKKNAAGLGVKSGRFIGELPKEAVAAADLLGFPILSVPEKFAFRDIINPVIAAIVDRQSARLIYSDKIHNEFLRLAVNGNDAGDVLSALRSLIGRSAVFVDMYFRRVCCSDGSGDICARFAGMDFDRITPELLSHYLCHKVSNSVENFGYIVLDRDGEGCRDDGVVRTALEYAAMVLTLRMMDRISSQRIEDKYRDVFLEDLLTNNVKTESEIHNRARLYGWDLRNGGFVAVVDINNIKKCYVTGYDLERDGELQEASRSIFDVSVSRMLAVFPNAKCYRQSDLAVFIISPDKYDQSRTYAQLEGVFGEIRRAIAGKMIFTVTMGVGEYFPNIRDIHKSYTQARTSINLGYQTEQFDCILFYSRMGIYRLLSAISGTKEAGEFIARYVKPLADYDAKYNAALTETLEAVIKSGWNLKKASGLLFIHYNSVKYRFAKICELLDADLHNNEERLAVDIALKLHMMNANSWQ